MMSAGYGGRGARYYGNVAAILAGVLVTDPPRQREAPRPKYVDTPFGRLPVTGATVLICGRCQGTIYPLVPGQPRCKCDYGG